MHLALARLAHLRPFADVTLSFLSGESTRRTTVVFGGDRTGKTTLLAAIATTRPGFAVPPPPGRREGELPPWVMCDWHLGEDDPERPHVLRVMSPSATLEDESVEQAAFRRKEQALFDRRAQEQGGFSLVLVSGARWFSRAPNMLSQPDRTVGRYDMRAAPPLDDATRADLTRETKQILSYATIGSAIEHRARTRSAQAGEAATGIDAVSRLGAFSSALEATLAILLEPFQHTWEGVRADSLEPIFRDDAGAAIPFEELPRGARHLVSIGALAVRALAAHCPEGRSPRDREGVVLVDDVEAGQDAPVQRILPQLLARALPAVQWILATSSPLVTTGCAPGETIVLRRGERLVEVHEGDQALIH
ncbi:MAG: hypothetical protein U0235_16730 [Polyangiaceae bacterium]